MRDLLMKNLTKYNNITTGKIYQTVIERERNGEYLGKTVQVVPHITNEIKSKIEIAGKVNNSDIVITEIGWYSRRYRINTVFWKLSDNLNMI